ncbi:MAG: hypothetical protein U0892_08395 [Pirellulales bacterium]
MVLFGFGSSDSVRADDLQAEEIRAWEFQRSEDRNADQWPDGWQRPKGRQFPSYISMKIQPRDPAAADMAKDAQFTLSRWMLAYRLGKWPHQVMPERTPEQIVSFMDRWGVDSCLQIDMNGGAGELLSPAFALDPRYTYSMDASLAVNGLKGHRAWVELIFNDADGAAIGHLRTPAVTGDKDWHTYMTSAFTHESLRMAQVIVHIDPTSPRALGGTVRVDGIRIYRMPKIELKIDLPHNVGRPNEPVEVTCAVLGIKNIDNRVSFKLLDFEGNEKIRTSVSLQSLPESVPLPSQPLAAPATNETPAAKKYVSARPSRADSRNRNSVAPPETPVSGRTAAAQNNLLAHPEQKRVDGVAKWKFQVAEPGFYTIVVDLGRTTHRRQTRQVSLAIAPQTSLGVGGPFGWSMPAFNESYKPEDVPGYLNTAGVGWIKLPVWFSSDQPQHADSLAILLERLDHRKISCIGRLENPPQDPNSPNFGKSMPAASVFNNPETWEPQLEPVLTRMSMKLSWFQLGQDNDLSFIGNSKLIPLLTDIRNRMQSFSQEMQLAIAWEWSEDLPDDKNLPWRASQMSATPQLTAGELTEYLSSSKQNGSTAWATLNPLPAQVYSLLDRCRDLTERMIAVKKTGAQAAFVTTPISAETGIFNPDGSAGEMLLPWRNLNRHLASADYLGSVKLPSGSTNHAFADGDQGLMILWNDRKVKERLYLGDDVQAIDLWGRTVEVKKEPSDHGTPEQEIEVGPWPIFVTGISVPVAKWRMQFQLNAADFANQSGHRAEIKVSVENTFRDSVQGAFTMKSNSLLQSNQNPVRIQLGATDRKDFDVQLALKPDASAGKHPLRFDFTLSGDQDVSFSCYESLSLGIGDVEILWDAIHDGNGNITLHMELNNKTNRPLSFKCKLHAPNQPYRGFQIPSAQPGHTIRDLRFPIGNLEADTTIWLNCVEPLTNRVLNYKVPVHEPGED